MNALFRSTLVINSLKNFNRVRPVNFIKENSFINYRAFSQGVESTPVSFNLNLISILIFILMFCLMFEYHLDLVKIKRNHQI